MPTTTNYGWTTPADTDLVKDGASAIRTLGSSVDTTVKALNPETTLGDISYRSSTANTNTRLAIGTTGQVLTVSGGVPAWATPAGGSGMTQLASGNLPAANNVVLSTISGDYINLLLFVRDYVFASEDYLAIRLNGDTGTSYGYIGVVQSAEDTAAVSCDGRRTNIIATFDDGKEDVDRNAFSEIYIPDYANTTHNKTIDVRSVSRDDTDTYNTQVLVNANFNSSSAITSITILTLSGNNFSSGSYVLYGVK